MSTVAVIPARGGSERIPRKNVLPFCGKPIIAWSIDTALTSGLFDAVIVSTDDDEIRNIALQFGAEAPFRRDTYADAHSGIRDVIVHSIEALAELGRKPSLLCCLLATAPFVRAFDLRRGRDTLLESGAHFAYAVTKYRYPIERALRLRPDGRIEMRFPKYRLARSQDVEAAYHDAGQFYWGHADSFLDRSKPIPAPNSVPVFMPAKRVQDIDDMEDWRRAEWMFRALRAEIVETDRLLLRPMEQEDTNYVVALRKSSADTDAFIERTPITSESHRAWFLSPRPNRIDYIIERKADHMPIGTLHFKNIDANSGSAESGRLIQQDCRGQGYGKESAIAWLRHGFLKLGFREIYGITSVRNHANIALNKTLGYIETPAGDVPDQFMRMLLTRERASECGWLTA